MDEFENKKNETSDDNLSSDSVKKEDTSETSQDGYYRYTGEEIKDKSDENGYSAGNEGAASANSNPGSGAYNSYNPQGQGSNYQNPGYTPPPYGNPGYNSGYQYGNPSGNYGRPYPYANGGQGNAEKNYAYSQEPQNSENKPRKNKGGIIFAVIAGVLCVALIIALIAVVAGGSKDKEIKEDSTSVSEHADVYETEASPETGNTSLPGDALTPKGIYEKIAPSSVGILVYDKNKALASEGSGVLFQESTDGKKTYIVTCAHVIAGSSKMMVQLHDGTEHEAALVGFDTRTDIGVLSIEAAGLSLAPIGDSSKIAVGDPVYAIGNPGGVEFANSFTNGMVSALDRPVSSSTGYTMECIQHTAAINPGNSGGALVNSFGQVIGINSMKIVADEYEGMGFSVPSSVFVGIVNNIMENGYVSNRPKLGITYVAASSVSKYGMFVAIKELPSGSIVIHDIAEDSALAGTDAQPGDLIIAVNGHDLDKPDILPELIEQSSVGDKLTLSLIRIHDDYSYDEIEVTATLVEDRGDTFANEAPETTTPQNPEDFFNDFFKEYFGEGFPTP